MPGFRDAFRQGREAGRQSRERVIAARIAPPQAAERRDAGEDRPQIWDDAPDDPTLEQRENEFAECKRLLGEMTDYAEMMEARVIELIAGAEPMAKALRLPGVRTFLLQRFHPDKHSAADGDERALLTAALKTINAAYAFAGQLQTSSDSSSPESSS